MITNLALVGTGIIAQFHVDALQTTDATLHTICDIDEAAGSALAQRVGAQYEPEYKAVLADPNIQAVVLATPNHTHYALARDAVEAGKDVFCEKPMTISPEQSADLVRRVLSRPDQIFQVGYMKRYNPGFRLVKETLPRLGELLSAHIRVLVGSRPSTAAKSTTWHGDPAKSGGGILYHSGSHLMDVTRFLFGDPTRVTSRLIADPNTPGRELSTMTLIDVEQGPPVYFSTVKTEIPKVGHAQQGWEETVEIIGTKGRVALSSPNWEGTLPCIVTLQMGEDDQVRTIFPADESQWALEFQAFVESLKTREQQHPDVVDGYKVDEVLACIVESAAEGAPVPIEWQV